MISLNDKPLSLMRVRGKKGPKCIAGLFPLRNLSIRSTREFSITTALIIRFAICSLNVFVDFDLKLQGEYS